jgi:prolyl-tRNA synthetase
VAPFALAVVALDPAAPEVMKAADAIADRLAAGGADVFVDDRDERPGVRFRDAELIGFPFRVTVGARMLELLGAGGSGGLKPGPPEDGNRPGPA